MNATESKMSAKEYFDYQGFGGKLLFTVALAVISLALAAWGGFLSTKQFAFSWLFAFSFFFTILTGSLFWILVHHAVDADWSVVCGGSWKTWPGFFRSWPSCSSRSFSARRRFSNG
jgi:hypothetical protein